jgi:ketosteroid isomerase-like protein
MIVTLILIGSLAAQEPVKTPASPRIITATKQVTEFTALETLILKAVQKKDREGLQSLVSEDFMISMPGADPLAGDDWMDQVMGKDYNLKSFEVRQFSVSDLGDSALVVFDRSLQATYKGKADNGQYFVVDLWKKSGDSWKLATRYVSKVSAVAAPAATGHKPTGKQ